MSFIAAMVLPYVMYKTSQDVVKATFINVTVCSVGLIVSLADMFSTASYASAISSLIVLFGVHSALILFSCSASYFIHKFIRK